MGWVRPLIIDIVQLQFSPHDSRFNDVYGYQADSSWIPDIIMKYENIPMSFMDRMKNALWPAYWYWVSK